MARVESPLSPSSPVTLLARYQASGLIDEWRKTFGIDICGELRGVTEISLYRCSESGLDFFTPASAAGSPALYRELQKFDWFYMRDKWEFSEAIKDLAGSRRILEVGSGQGFFIEKAGKSLKCDAIKGIESSAEAVEKARKRGLPVEMAGLTDIRKRGEAFDAVCAFQVLEHAANPGEFLKDMTGVLRAGGLLILSVPNRESFLKYQHNLLDMPPHHMTRWSAETFKYLEKILPLRLRKISYEPLARYHVRGYVSANLGRAGIPGVSVLEPFASALLFISGAYRFLQGQSLYALFEKL